MTADGDEWIVITWLLGSLETYETGTTTGDLHVDGITTVAGTKTNDETGTEIKADVGIETITYDGTESGTLDH
jgi:hypothetical protein